MNGYPNQTKSSCYRPWWTGKKALEYLQWFFSWWFIFLNHCSFTFCSSSYVNNVFRQAERGDCLAPVKFSLTIMDTFNWLFTWTIGLFPLGMTSNMSKSHMYHVLHFGYRISQARYWMLRLRAFCGRKDGYRLRLRRHSAGRHPNF